MTNEIFKDDEHDTDPVKMYRFRQLERDLGSLEKRSETLSLSQVWLLAKYLGIALTVATGVFGTALWVVIKDAAEARAEAQAKATAADIARSTAKTVSHAEIVASLVKNDDFIEAALGKLDSLLPNAIVTFDGECPEGWSSFKDLGGRVIVGAGQHSNRDENGAPLMVYQSGAEGGEESHILATNELAHHRHGLPYLSITTDLGFKDGGTGLNIPYFDVPKDQAAGQSQVEFYPAANGVNGEGKNQPHNNMPPYYALNFCKKE